MTTTNDLAGTDWVSLPDCSMIEVRPLARDDSALLVEIFDGLGPRSRHLRFLSPKRTLTPADLRHLTNVDHHDHDAIVAFSLEDGRPIGVARFFRRHEDPETAEVAVTVVDDWQGRGVGTVLATALGQRARFVGITGFYAMMSYENAASVRLMRRLTPDVERLGGERGAVEYLLHLPDAVVAEAD
jgi:RimJ/RimL family protein N-acetyltransferase